ncbi:MAG: hypothetical protein KJO78_02530 [Alphaproteobacteria bacterium]|nr:hypothetical protein [Alphaproteobacteria bacterium]
MRSQMHLTLILFVVSVAILLVFGRYSVVELPGGVAFHSGDDHMITQRVAWNFFSTGRPEFNPGEAVAANTSLFWPIILSPVYAIFGLQNAVMAVITLSCVLSGLTIVLAVRLLESPLAQAVAAVFLTLTASFLYLGPTAWEHIPQTLLVTLAFLGVLRASQGQRLPVVPISSLWLMAAAFLVRPDTAPLVALFVGTWFVTERNYAKSKSYLILAGLCVAPLVYLALMHAFYGEFVPNTAHLKVQGFRESVQLGVYHVTSSRAGIFPLLLLVLLLLRPRDAGAAFVSLAGLIQVSYVIAIGGDVFFGGRFFIVLLPIVTVTLLRELEWRSSSAFIRRGVLAALAFVAMVSFAQFLTRPNNNAIAEQVRIADALSGRIAPQDGSVGLHYLGIGYHLPAFHVVDFLGKAEPVIARSPAKFGPIGHNKWDYEYAFSAYEIAAFPFPAFRVDAVAQPDYAPPDDLDLLGPWMSAAYFMSNAKTHTFIRPEVFGNSPGGFGLFVRNDLLDRFGDLGAN